MKKEKPIEENNYQLKYLKREDIRELLKTNMDIIIGNIQKIMKEKNITQEELAGAMRSEQTHVSYMLRKRGNGITINVMGRIAFALNTTISDLAK